MILTSYLALQAIDESILEAARSLGAPFRTILFRLLLPLSLPGLAAGAVLIFVPVAGSFMEPRILGGKHGIFYGTLIEDQFVATFNWPLGAALSFILLAVGLVGQHVRVRARCLGAHGGWIIFGPGHELGHVFGRDLFGDPHHQGAGREYSHGREVFVQVVG